MLNPNEYVTYDGLGLAELVRTGQVAPAELVETAVSQIERLNPRLNAVIHKFYDHARAAATGALPDGPFRGVPFLLKDLFAMLAGTPLCNGSRALRDFIAPHDTELVRRHRASGLIILGKTNTPELGLTPYTEPELWGTTQNPWDPDRTPGGSSGGAAAAVAAGMVPMAHGSDGAGSIRIPASCCGLFGLKPTRGRLPTGPDFGELWQGLAVEHVLTRSVRDSAAMLDATAGPDPGAPNYPPPPTRPFLDEVTTDPGRLRIAFTTRPFLGRTVHEDCIRAAGDAASLLQELGHDVAEASPPVDGPRLRHAFTTLVAAETWADIELTEQLTGRPATWQNFEGSTWILGLLGTMVSGPEYVTAVRILQQSARAIGQFFTRYDVLLTPTLAAPPFPTGQLQPTPAEAALMPLVNRLGAKPLLAAGDVTRAAIERLFNFIPYTPLFNITGQPAMSVPLYWNSSNLPVGVHFAARFGDEATLLRLAGQLEQARPWFNRIDDLQL